MSDNQFAEDFSSVATAHPAATVIPLRDIGGTFEVLLLQRNPELRFQGGAWVFPGGRVDPEDFSVGDDQDLVAAARRAAVRETAEESGLQVIPRDLIPVSHWTTPEDLPKRFATWFFVTHVGEQAVQIDGQEICDHCWYKPQEALEARQAGAIVLLPPTFISILGLCKYSSSDMALAGFAELRPGVFCPRVSIIPGGFCQLYEGDVAYDSGELDTPGQRHRLRAVETDWRYERTEF